MVKTRILDPSESSKVEVREKPLGSVVRSSDRWDGLSSTPFRCTSSSTRLRGTSLSPSVSLRVDGVDSGRKVNRGTPRRSVPLHGRTGKVGSTRASTDVYIAEMYLVSLTGLHGQ